MENTSQLLPVIAQVHLLLGIFGIFWVVSQTCQIQLQRVKLKPSKQGDTGGSNGRCTIAFRKRDCSITQSWLTIRGHSAIG